MSLAAPCFGNYHSAALEVIEVRCSNPSVSSRQASYPSPLSKAHRIAHSAAVPLKIKAFALILLRRIDFRRQPCEAKASQGDLRKSIGRATAPFAQGSLWVRQTISPYSAQVLLSVIFTSANVPTSASSPLRCTSRPPLVLAVRFQSPRPSAPSMSTRCVVPS